MQPFWLKERCTAVMKSFWWNSRFRPRACPAIGSGLLGSVIVWSR